MDNYIVAYRINKLSINLTLELILETRGILQWVKYKIDSGTKFINNLFIKNIFYQAIDKNKFICYNLVKIKNSP